MSLFSWLFPHKAQVQDNRDALRTAWRDQFISSMIKAGMAGQGHRIKSNYTLFYSERRFIIRKKE